jgi:vancomycin resistance protein YoaR
MYVSDKRHWQWPVGVSRRVALMGAGVVAVIVIFVVLGFATMGSGIPRGTTVLGVSIGGLSQSEATAALEKEFASREKVTITVSSGRKTFPISPADAGLSFDAAATVAQASDRTWNPFALVSQFFTNRTLDPVVVVDQAALSTEVDSFATVVDRPFIEPTIDMKALTPITVKGQTGKEINREAAAAAITQAFATGADAVQISTVETQPSVSDETLVDAKKAASQAVSAPVFINVGTLKAKVGVRAIARSLSFDAQNGVLVPVLDGAILHAAVAPKLESVETPGRDASFASVSGKTVIVPSKVGKGVSDQELSSAVTSVIAKSPPNRTVEVTVGVREPALSTQGATDLGVQERMSTFTQNFPYAAYRKQNIGEAARRVNGSVVMPGETFSMNEAMKERTVANGYTVGFVIGQGGIFAQELGGGVSTATTTTWTAAYYAGMEPVQVIAHSIYISRYKAGLEATVAWGIFDMKFKNPYDTPVYIQASANSTSITVSFWGTPIYSEIKAEFGPKRDIKPFKTIYDESAGCLGQGGMEGFAIDVDRVFYKDGVEVKRQTITTKYKSSPEVICGKEKLKKPGTSFGPAPTPAPSASKSAAKASSSPSASPFVGDGAPTVRSGVTKNND